jgi:hypothetical protein
MSNNISDLVISGEPVFVEIKKQIYNGKAYVNGEQFGIYDLQEPDSDKIYTPSGFCAKYLGYNCNGWTKVYVIRDGKRVTLNDLRKNTPTHTATKTKKAQPTPKKSPPTPKRTHSPQLVEKTKPADIAQKNEPIALSPTKRSPTPKKSPSTPKRTHTPQLAEKAKPSDIAQKNEHVASPAKKEEDITGASIVIWYYDASTQMPMVLVGNESKYVTDIRPEIKPMQTITGVTNPETAKRHFYKVSAALSDNGENTLNLGRIQYDDPKQVGDSFSVNYRYVDKKSKQGIIKGQIESGETPIQAIVREVAEELGLHLHKKTQAGIQYMNICDGYAAYALEIPETDVTVFQTRIKERIDKKRGELFALKFEPLDTIVSSLKTFNYKSKCTIEHFQRQYFPEITGK